MASSDLQIRITAKDELSPVIRRMRRELWWVQHGGIVLGLFAGLGLFLSGLLTGLVLR